MHRLFSRFRHDHRGAAAIEFALVATALFLLLMGTLEFALVQFASGVVENAATVAARYGITGDNYSEAGAFQKNAAGVNRQEFVSQTIRELSGGLMDGANVKISTQQFGSLGGANFSDPSGATENGGFGSGGQGVMYYITYEWELFTPLVGQFFPDGKVQLTSAVLVANEEFE